jgi:hypothetical protein
MILHFREAQNDLSTLPLAGDFYHQTPPAHQANHVDMIADLVAQRLLETVTPLLDPAPPPPFVAATVTNPPDHVAAATSNISPDLTSIQNQLQQLVSLMSGTSVVPSGNSLAPRGPPTNNFQLVRSTGRGRGRGGSGGRDRRQPTPGPRMYCWSHGACAHSSTDCNNKSPGHQATATFSNMQGGSTNRCFWLPSST